MSGNLSLEYLPWTVWIVAGSLTLIGLFFAVKIYQNKITFGQAKYMGITKDLFSWMNVIYGLILFEAAYGVVSFFLDLPLWTDISLILLILVLLMIVYRKLQSREKFKPVRFKFLFLIPLGIHGPLTMGKMILPTEAPIKEFIQRFVKETSTEKFGIRETPAKQPIVKRNNFPRRDRVRDSGYEVEFQDSLAKGTFGDQLTAKLLTARGYRKEPSKLGNPDKRPTRGIDGVYTRHESNGDLQEILIVENKVDGGKLATKQMTDERIAELVEKMLVHADPEVRRTGKLIRENPGLVRKELWHHYLASGKTTVSRLNAEARKTSIETYNYIGSATRKRCESSKPSIVCIPSTQ